MTSITSVTASPLSSLHCTLHSGHLSSQLLEHAKDPLPLENTLSLPGMLPRLDILCQSLHGSELKYHLPIEPVHEHLIRERTIAGSPLLLLYFPS